MVAFVAALDVEVIAVVFMVVLLTAVLIVRPLLVNLLGGAPFIGGWLASNVDAGIGAFLRAITPAANATLGVFSRTVDWLAWSWGRVVGNLSGFAVGVYAFAHRTVTLTIPHAVHLASAAIDAAISDARTYAYNLAVNGGVYAERLVTAAEAKLAGSITDARTYAYNLAVNGGIYAERLVGAAEGRVVAAIGAERDFAVAELRLAEGYADSLFSQATAIGAAAEAALRNDLAGEATALGRLVSDNVKNLEKEIAGVNAGTVALATGTVAAVVAEVAAIRASKCMQMCDPLGQLGAELQGLDLLLFFAMAETAYNDPAKFRAGMLDVIRPMAAGATSGVKAVLGVP